MKPLIIAGIPRTGTTITTRVLNTHPQISVGEEDMLLLRCLEFVEGLQLNYPAHGQSGSVRAPTIEDLEYRKNVLAKNVRLSLEEVYDAGSYTYWGDKFPYYIFKMQGMRRILPEVKYIITYSDEFKSRFESWLSMWWSEKADPEHYKDFWARAIAIIDRHENDENVCTVKLEDLKGDPAGTFERIADFLEIENEFDTSLIEKR